jgi:hypothetical protein
MGLLAASPLLAGTPVGAVPAADSPSILAPEHEASLPVTVRVTTVPGLMEGDASMDGRTNIVDAMFVAQYAVGLRTLDSYELCCADTNDDGHVNIIDAMHIAQYAVDSTGAGGILFAPLWEQPQDDDMLDPLTWNG